MSGFKQTTAELVNRYHLLLGDSDETVRNRAAEELLFKIQIRERLEDDGGGLYGLHIQSELRQMLERGTQEKRITSPLVIGWVENNQAEVARVKRIFEEAVAHR